MPVKSNMEHDLQIQQIAPDTFQNASRHHQTAWNIKNRNSFGGSLFYQALLAAYRTLHSEAYKPCTAHIYFLAAAVPDQETRYAVTRLRDSQSYVHREVKVYQRDKHNNEMLLMVLMVLFNTNVLRKKSKFGPQPVIQYSPLSGTALSYNNNIQLDNLAQLHRNNPSRFFPFKRDLSGLLDWLVLQQRFKLNTVDDALNLQAVELWQPKELLDDVLYQNSNSSNPEAPISSTTINEREMFSLARAIPSKDTAAVNNTATARHIAYHLFLSYLSDYELLSSALPLTGLARYGTEKFLVSLDHAVYFHTDGEELRGSQYDWHVVRGKIIKGARGQYTIMIAIYNQHAETVAVCVQEALILLENGDGKAILPGETRASQRGSKL